MKRFVVLVLCLCATPAYPQEFQFSGDFVETYMAEKGFLDKIPRGTRFNCEETVCSFTKAVRIYVFRNREGTKRFWSTDYSDVMFDEPQMSSVCGRTGHIIHYDETGQLLYRSQMCEEVMGRRVEVTFSALALN